MSLRIAYAGIIQLIARFSTLITGLVFVTIVTRNLPTEDFGLWQVLGSSVALLLIPLAPLEYWTFRYASRGKNVEKTALIAALISIPILSIIYIIFALTVSSSISTISLYVLVYSIQIPALCLWEVARRITATYKPEYLGYATIALEVGKVAGAYYTISILHLGLLGAIISLAFGQFLQLILIFYVIRPRIRGKFQLSIIKQWYKASIVPIMNSLVSRLSLTDVILVSIMVGSTATVAFIQASRTFTLIVRYSETFLRVLYPKLIRDNKSEDITLTFRLQSFVVIPLAIGGFSLAEPLLGILGEQYVAAANIMRILVILAVVEGIEYFMWNILTGTEKIDEDVNKLNLKELKNSWLIKLPVIDLTKTLTYFVILAIIVYGFRNSVDNITLGIYWATTILAITIVLTVYKFILAKRTINFKIPTTSIVKYIFAGSIMGIFLYLYQNYLPWTDTSVIGTLSYLIIPGIISTTIYTIIVCISDSYIRNTITNAIKKSA